MMGVGGGAVHRLIELGKRKRRDQLVAARALLLRDGDGALEGYLCSGFIPHQKNFAFPSKEN
jgi:hypothetical protein